MKTSEAPPIMSRYTLSQLRAMPTISQGHFDNLKLDDGRKRVWLSRCGVADGLPYDNGVTVERLRGGVWVTAQEYQASEEIEALGGGIA